MKKKVLSYAALSSALLTAAPLLGNVTANAATTSNSTTSSSVKVSSSSSSVKESSKVSATSSSKVADKKEARSAVRTNDFARANNFAEAVSTTSTNNQSKQNTGVKPADVQNLIKDISSDKAMGIADMSPEEQSNLINSINTNSTVVPNVYGNGFELKQISGGMHSYPVLYFNGQPFTGYDAQDNVFWYKGEPYTLSELQKAGIKVPQNVVNAMKQAATKSSANKVNNGSVRLASGQTIRTYGYNHYVTNVNAKTLPKTGESNSVITLLKSLF